MLDPDYVSVSVTPDDVSKIHDFITRRVRARTGLTFTEYAGASPDARQEILKLLEPPVEQKCPQCAGASTNNWYSSELISFGLEFSELKTERITPEMLAPAVATSAVGEFLDKWTSLLNEAISEMDDPQQTK